MLDYPRVETCPHCEKDFLSEDAKDTVCSCCVSHRLKLSFDEWKKDPVNAAFAEAIFKKNQEFLEKELRDEEAFHAFTSDLLLREDELNGAK
jgi:hypothetical protein